MQIPHDVRNDIDVSVGGNGVFAFGENPISPPPIKSPVIPKRNEETWFSVYKSFLLLLCIIWSLRLSAQTVDTSKAVKHAHPYPSVLKATLLSAVVPGLGQFYNKRYWKIPIVYVGVAVTTYFIVTNQNYYNTYNNALKTRDAGGTDPYYNIYSSSEMSTIITYYHRNRDISVIAAAAIYVLQLVDANVDAQLHGFDVSDNISLHFTPNIIPNPLTGACSIEGGFSLIKRF